MFHRLPIQCWATNIGIDSTTVQSINHTEHVMSSDVAEIPPVCGGEAGPCQWDWGDTPGARRSQQCARRLQQSEKKVHRRSSPILSSTGCLTCGRDCEHSLFHAKHSYRHAVCCLRHGRCLCAPSKRHILEVLNSCTIQL